MTALGSKKLPLCPGDMLFFQASGQRLLIVAATEQCAESGSVGQRVAGLTSATHRWWWSDFWIDWTGLDTAWTIHRLPVYDVRKGVLT